VRMQTVGIHRHGRAHDAVEAVSVRSIRPAKIMRHVPPWHSGDKRPAEGLDSTGFAAVRRGLGPSATVL
jgi:hypothetical protein